MAPPAVGRGGGEGYRGMDIRSAGYQGNYPSGAVLMGRLGRSVAGAGDKHVGSY